MKFSHTLSLPSPYQSFTDQLLEVAFQVALDNNPDGALFPDILFCLAGVENSSIIPKFIEFWRGFVNSGLIGECASPLTDQCTSRIFQLECVSLALRCVIFWSATFQSLLKVVSERNTAYSSANSPSVHRFSLFSSIRFVKLVLYVGDFEHVFEAFRSHEKH
jgi:hypothetical protein